MGFGSGYHSRTNRGGRRYDNSQLAHVWNAQTEESGQSNNGNFYFSGRTLYSYGSHFVVGYIMPDGVAFLNGDSYSVSTSGHQSDARSAVSNRATFTVRGLTELRDLLAALSRDGRLSADWRRRARTMIREHAEALAAAFRCDPGESRWQWSEELGRSVERTEGETAGAYLCRLAGIASSWPKLQREAAAAKAKAKREADKAKAEQARSRAIRLADMPEGEWRGKALAILNPAHNAHSSNYAGEAEQRLERLALELLRALKLANAEGFSKRRRETLKRRRRETAERIAEASAIEAILNKRVRLRSDIATVRAIAERWRGVDDMPSDYWQIRGLGDGAKALARLAESPAFPFATRRRLKLQAERLEELEPRLSDEWHAKAEERREREAAKRAADIADNRRAWLAGEPVRLLGRFDAESGGAALRIAGDMLQTSHGAEVPLSHAIKAFRFIKLCRENGRAWHCNGQQIRVGHFRVDSISESGDMVAGCHSFTWPEIERVAILAGVFELPADDSAVIGKVAA